MLDARSPVATIVLDHSECAVVFARHRVDYCCHGQRPLVEVCREQGLDVLGILDELQAAIARRGPAPELDPRTLTTADLIASVIAQHHAYLHRTLPTLRVLAHKVARRHSERVPALVRVATIFEALADTLIDHLASEEEVLFPAVVEQRPADVRALLLGMREEHEDVGRMLVALRMAAADYVVPDWACTSYRTLMSELAALEADTLRHVHVENHVLLPRFVPPPSSP